MNSHLAATLYSWGRRLSAKSNCFFPSVNSVATYFGRDRTTVLRALQELVQQGWSEIVQREPGKPVVYRFLDHDEWARTHPGCCLQKDAMTWEGDGDRLGRALFAASGGQAKFLPNQMNGLRTSGLEDDEIARGFRVFLDRNPQAGRAWKGVYYRFRTHLLRLADDLLNRAAAKNTYNAESHRRDTWQSHGCNTPSRTDATPTGRTGASQVFDLRIEREGKGSQMIPALRSQERSTGSLTKQELPGRGFPPSKPSPTEQIRAGWGESRMVERQRKTEEVCESAKARLEAGTHKSVKRP